MAEKISITKGFDDDTFDTYVPELSDNANIQNALELFYYGNSDDGNATGDVSLHATIVDFDTRITSTTSGLSGHTGAISDVHGVGAGNSIVGTGTTQTLTNKTLTSPTITSPSISSPTITGTAVLPSTTSIGNVSSTEIGYVDGVTSSIQTQINTNTPVGMISIHAGSSAPTGWLLCDGTSYASASYVELFNVVGYTFGGSGSAFAVPNLKGRVIVGMDAAQTEFDTRGELGGTMNHYHAASNSGNTSIGHDHTIPALSGNTSGAGLHSHTIGHNHLDNFSASSSGGSHSHGDNFATGTGSPNTVGLSGGATTTAASVNHTHTVNGSVSTDTDHAHTITVAGSVTAGGTNSGDNSNHSHTVSNDASATTGGAGGNHAHTTPASDIVSNLQPYMALNYIIKF